MTYLELRDARLHYDVRGERRPAVVLVHGALCSGRDWSHQAAHLSEDFTVVTLDLRGHGRSDAPFETCTVEQFGADVNALVESLRLDPVVLVGHSLAARVVIEAAGRRPGNVAGLVLLDGSRMGAAAGVPAAVPVPAPARPTDDEVLARIAVIIEEAVGSFGDAATAAHIRTTMSSAPVGLMRSFLSTIRAWDAGRFATALDSLPAALPVTAVQSTHIGYGIPRRSLPPGATSTAYLDEVRQRVPQLRTVILPGVGHFSMLEAAEQVTDLIAAFAAEHGAVARARPAAGAGLNSGGATADFR